MQCFCTVYVAIAYWVSCDIWVWLSCACLFWKSANFDISVIKNGVQLCLSHISIFRFHLLEAILMASINIILIDGK